MTTDAERECYYRLARDNAARGAVVELGAWLGAATAYIAAGVRDSGVTAKVHVFDKFESKPGHLAKVRAWDERRGIKGRVPIGPCLAQFRINLASLIKYVQPHPGLIENLKWGDEPIAVLIADAPKRVPQISSVLTKLRKALKPSSIMAWQDFCHFPSYEIPACLYLLKDRIEFVEAVVPGTTLVFRLLSQWTAEEVSAEALALENWTPERISQAWLYWLSFVPKEKTALFRCGEAMFLCDIGAPAEAVAALSLVRTDDLEAIIGKWRYLKEARPDFVKRYKPLFDFLQDAL